MFTHVLSLFTRVCNATVFIILSFIIYLTLYFCKGELRTNWKQLRTEGSMLEPPKEATSPSCRGIWMESWRRRPRLHWSQKPVALATCLNKTAGWMGREEGWMNKIRRYYSGCRLYFHVVMWFCKMKLIFIFKFRLKMKNWSVTNTCISMSTKKSGS